MLDLSKVCELDVRAPHQKNNGGIRRQHVGQILRKKDAQGALEQTFEILQRYGMKLNPNKCAFGVRLGKFLGYLVTQRGIEADPDQIEALQNIQHPTTSNEVQHLTGKLAALCRFVARYSEKTYHFFSIFKKGKKFE